jgi:hypothetical protein
VSDERGRGTRRRDTVRPSAYAEPSALDRAVDRDLIDLPALYRQADGNARKSQRRYRLLLGYQLLFALLASSCGALASMTTGAWPGYAASGASLLIVLLRMWHRATHADTAWYDARATAEQVKSLAWRYATRTEPFGPELSDGDADALLLERLRDAASGPGSVSPGNGQQITSSMRTLRSAPLAERVDTYKRERVADQLRWYTCRAHSAQAAAERWDAAFFVFSSAALLAGILLAQTGINLVGVFAALAGTVVTWAGGRRYAALGRAYGRAALDLSLTDERATVIPSDRELSEFVSTLEATMTGEHERWRSMRQ